MLDLTNQERQFIYQWIGSLLSRELTEEQIVNYQSGGFDSLFEFLDELGFQEKTTKIRTALQLQDSFRLELAADFAHCFLLEGKLSAIPYLSAYLEGQALDQALALVDNWMAHYQVSINRDHNEPSDHISILISILIKLIETGSHAEQQQFINVVLLSWIPQFAEKAQKVRLKTQIYPAVIDLLVAFLKQDLSNEVR